MNMKCKDYFKTTAYSWGTQVNALHTYQLASNSMIPNAIPQQTELTLSENIRKFLTKFASPLM